VPGEPSASIETRAPPPGDLVDRGRWICVPAGVHDRLGAQFACAAQGSIGDIHRDHACPERSADHDSRQPHPAASVHRQPVTATDLAVCGERRNAVANRQARHAAVTKSTESGSATRFTSAAWIATRSAKDPGPLKPGCVWSGQTCASPARQYSHAPHPQTNGTVTRSPGRHRRTAGPTSTTVPASS
jgi:hypothetical protein